MREEIRLGNEALAQKDFETAVGYFQQLLDAGGTAVQERIALNRLREIEALRAHTVLRGEVPSPLNPPSGCVFHPRCPVAESRCSAEIPQIREVKAGHWAACHLA